jgi:hypothetical protein
MHVDNVRLAHALLAYFARVAAHAATGEDARIYQGLAFYDIDDTSKPRCLYIPAIGTLRDTAGDDGAAPNLLLLLPTGADGQALPSTAGGNTGENVLVVLSVGELEAAVSANSQVATTRKRLRLALADEMSPGFVAEFSQTPEGRDYCASAAAAFPVEPDWGCCGVVDPNFPIATPPQDDSDSSSWATILSIAAAVAFVVVGFIFFV